MSAVRPARRFRRDTRLSAEAVGRTGRHLRRSARLNGNAVDPLATSPGARRKPSRREPAAAGYARSDGGDGHGSPRGFGDGAPTGARLRPSAGHPSTVSAGHRIPFARWRTMAAARTPCRSTHRGDGRGRVDRSGRRARLRGTPSICRCGSRPPAIPSRSAPPALRSSGSGHSHRGYRGAGVPIGARRGVLPGGSGATSVLMGSQVTQPRSSGRREAGRSRRRPRRVAAEDAASRLLVRRRHAAVVPLVLAP